MALQLNKQLCKHLHIKVNWTNNLANKQLSTPHIQKKF